MRTGAWTWSSSPPPRSVLRAGFERLGWLSERLVWMRHEAPVPPGPQIEVEQVHYEVVRHLRVAWHREDFPEWTRALPGPGAGGRDDARHAGASPRSKGGRPVAFAQLERLGDRAELSQLYVLPEHRGGGRGTALTRAAIAAAGDVPELWIVADDEDRPKQLYARLGFRPAWTAVELLRLPAVSSTSSSG